MNIFIKVLFISIGLFSASANANYELIASSGENQYNLPEQTFWISSSLEISNSGTLCFSMGGASAGIVRYGFLCASSGEDLKRYIVNAHEAVSSFRLFHDNQTDEKYIVFAPNNGSEHLGIYTFNLATGKRLEHENFEGQFSGLSGVSMNSENMLVYRQSFGGKKARVITKTSGESKEVLSSFSDDISYVFSPKSQGRYILTKVRMGKFIGESSPDRLYLYDAQRQARQIVMQDKDGLPSSKVLSIMNQYTVNANGEIAVWAKTKNATKLYASKQGILKPILTLGDMVSNYDAFDPSMNIHGDLIIRGYDKQKRASIFTYINGKWSKLLGEGDKLSFDGVDYEVADATTSPFVHAPRINDNNTVAFIVYVVNKQTNKLSTMVLKKKL